MINTKNSRPNSANISNSHKSINLLQSPKISSTKFRRDIIIDSNINKNKLFSLNDINDKITNQRGTELPIQYKRRSEKELDELFTIKEYKSYKKEDKESKKNKTLKKEHLSFDERKNLNNPIKNSTNDISINNLTIDENKIKRQQTSITLRKKNKNFSNENLNNKPTKSIKQKIKYKPIHTENDYYLPKNYIHYYKFVTNPEFYKEKINDKIQSITPHYKLINYKEIKAKASESDIFMQKEIKDSREINYNSFRERKSNNNYYNESDIFNRKKDLNDFEKKKTGEKFLFKSELAKNKISNIADSNSDWEAKKSLLITSKNLPSTKYNIISPRLINHIPIKSDIIKYNKTKGIDEFIDLTRVTSSNPNLDYVKVIKENPYAFRKVREMCNDYYESYNPGKNILRKPF